MTNALFSTRFLSITLALSLIFNLSALAQDGHDHDGHNHDAHGHTTAVEEEVDELHNVIEEDEAEFDAKKMIMHHIADAHDWHFWGSGHHSVSLPLPVILYSKEGGFAFFMSSAFHHDDAGTHAVEKNGVSYLKFHEKIYFANAAGGLDMEHGHPANAKPFDFSITKNVAAMLFAAFVMILLFGATARGYKKNGVPGGIGKYLEPLVLFVRDEIAVPNIGEKKAQRYLPYLLTAFFFIWIINIFGLFPSGANLTGNIAFTLTLSFFTLLAVNMFANKDYWKHILMPPVPWPMWIIMIPVELIGVFTKPFALMMRLFANITAGHILMLSLVSLIFMFKTALMGFVSVPFMIFMTFLELLVAALQAYIFTLLSALFIGLAVAEHDHGHDHHHEPEPADGII